MTVIPLQKKELTLVDFDDDRVVDITKYSSEDFGKVSMLNRFDKDNNGLSPEEFIGESYIMMDTNRDHAIDIIEWRSAYVSSLSPMSAKQYRYND